MLVAMRLELTTMARLPWPSAPQRDAFIEHVCWAHSWYKHLSLVEPAQFVVFLAEDAAAGFESSERLHYSWKTTAEYRQRFGLLDYAWRHPGDPGWSRDAHDDVEPAPEVLAVAGFPLGPLCSSDGNAIEVICSLWSDRDDLAGPLAAAVRVLDDLRRDCEDAYDALTELERDAVAADDMDVAVTGDERTALGGPPVARYRQHQRRLFDHYQSLRAPEVARIRAAIDRLGDALSRPA